jgi:hypothetical protein
VTVAQSDGRVYRLQLPGHPFERQQVCASRVQLANLGLGYGDRRDGIAVERRLEFGDRVRDERPVRRGPSTAAGVLLRRPMPLDELAAATSLSSQNISFDVAKSNS